MKVILIEDEQHKANDLRLRILDSGVSSDNLCISSGVREAVLNVSTDDYDLIVLDMALPTFAGGGLDGSGGGTAQAVGGIEVLRMLKMLGRRANIIIVTQYPDIILDGRKIKLSQVGKMVMTKYGQNVLGVVLYSINTQTWRQQFDTLIRRAK